MTPEWLLYENSGATRNQPLAPELVRAMGFLPELGLSMKVFSGGQPGIGTSDARVGSTRHDHGGAADAFFYRGNERLDWANPEHVPLFQDIVRRAKAVGVTGFGAGPGYMQPGSMHIGFGAPAVWGAGGSGANAPDWLREAFGAAPAGQPSQPLSFGSAVEGGPGLAAMFAPTADGLSMGFPTAPQGQMAKRKEEEQKAQKTEQTARRLALADLIRF